MLFVVAIRPNVCFDHAIHNIEFRDYRSSKPNIYIAKTLLHTSHHYSCTYACTINEACSDTYL